MAKPSASTPPPLYRDTAALCEWLLHHFRQSPDVLGQALCQTALSLLSSVVLALRDRDRDVRIEEADEQILILRAQLRLAENVGLLTDAQSLHGLQLADGIGRQLGGWRRSLGPV